MDYIEKYLRKAMEFFVDKLGYKRIPEKDFPPFFKHITKNFQWPDEFVVCVIREPDNTFFMMVVCYENAIADISVHYIAEDGVFHNVALACKYDDPFSLFAASKLKEIKAASPWKDIVKAIREKAGVQTQGTSEKNQGRIRDY